MALPIANTNAKAASPSLLDPFEEKYEAQDVALAADVTDEGDSAEVVDLLHLQAT